MRGLTWLILIVATAGISWRFPLFHVVSARHAAQEKADATFNPATFAEKFWDTKLLKSLDQAVKAVELIPAIQGDPAAAKTKYARTMGMSESYDYFVTGQGRVVAVSDDEVQLAITPGATNAEVALQVGLLFGNALRDGTGLLNVNDYPNSQDYNAISEAINHLAETRILPQLKTQAKVGGTISFTGCAEVNDESSDLKPLKVVPIKTSAE